MTLREGDGFSLSQTEVCTLCTVFSNFSLIFKIWPEVRKYCSQTTQPHRNGVTLRQVVDCASPLALCDARLMTNAGRFCNKSSITPNRKAVEGYRSP
jgi:hypothetical protein